MGHTETPAPVFRPYGLIVALLIRAVIGVVLSWSRCGTALPTAAWVLTAGLQIQCLSSFHWNLFGMGVTHCLIEITWFPILIWLKTKIFPEGRTDVQVAICFIVALWIWSKAQRFHVMCDWLVYNFSVLQRPRQEREAERKIPRFFFLFRFLKSHRWGIPLHEMNRVQQMLHIQRKCIFSTPPPRNSPSRPKDGRACSLDLKMSVRGKQCDLGL